MQSLYEYERAFRRAVILHALRASGGNRTHAARTLGLTKSYMFRLIRDLNLSIEAPPPYSLPRSRTTS